MMFYVSAIAYAAFFIVIMVNIAKNRYGSGLALSPLLTGYIISFIIFILLYYFGNVDVDPDPIYYTSISHVIPPVWIFAIASGKAAVLVAWAVICRFSIRRRHNRVGDISIESGAICGMAHNWEYVGATTRINCAYPNRGSGQYNDPCYGASCVACEQSVPIYRCSRCGATKDEYE